MWRTVKLGEACLVRRGTTITKRQAVQGEVPVIGGGTKPTYFHNEPNRAAKCITVSGSGASAGFVNKWEVPIFASDCSTVEPKDETQLHLFVYYYLMSRQQFIYDNFRSGAAQPHVYAKDIETLDYPIVPLAEQQRIVAKLDAAFAEISRFQTVCEEKLSDFYAMRLKTYQAIINKHCSEQSQYKLSELVAESCSLSYGIVQPGDEVADGLPVVRPVDLKSKWIGRKDLKLVAHERADSYQRTRLTGDEVLLCVRGSTGIVALASDELIGGNVTRGIIPIRFAKSVNSEYGYYALQSEDAQKQIADKTYGTTLQQINVKDVKNLVIGVPKIEEQMSAVAEIIEADDYLNELKSSTQRQLDNTKQLKSAILAQELQPPKSEAA